MILKIQQYSPVHLQATSSISIVLQQVQAKTTIKVNIMKILIQQKSVFAYTHNSQLRNFLLFVGEWLFENWMQN